MRSSTVTPEDALSALPADLRTSLLSEYKAIQTSYLERRWSSAELSGGRFSEIVFRIVEGYVNGSFPNTATKPPNFVQACKNLEQETNLPRSFRILIPRMLPALYEIRNNRNVGHVGGDVDPDFMDSLVVLSMCSWVLAELIRVLHGISTDEAQNVVDNIVEQKTSLVWKGGDIRRVLNPSMSYADQILVLVAAEGGQSTADDLFQWVEHSNRGNFNKILRRLHLKRLVEFESGKGTVDLLPPGKQAAADIVGRYS